ncbi:MAG TPA: hypothetical protein VF682_03715 [Pseudomonas sp.]|jgi:putative hydrolase of the HAD superfamily
MIVALMVDVDGALVRGRPKDGRGWASDLEADLGMSQVDLQKAFFVPYWNDIVTGRRGLAELLKAALETIAQDVSHHDLIDYWFANDARLDQALIAGLDRQRERGIKVYLATNQEHLRAELLALSMELAAKGAHAEDAPKGLLRITTSSIFAEFCLADALVGFLKRYPATC